MIAMALSCQPSLLIADEPTTALDVTIQAQILELLAKIQAQRGMAVLLITHDLGVVAEVCDRIIVMYAGQIVETGSVDDVFLRPRHPYSRGLLDSLPSIARGKGRLAPIPGQVPNPAAWPAACRFHDRCPHAWERCRNEMPPLFSAEGHTARCWLEVEPERRSRRHEPPVPGA
jgi:oligopeptide/dipeptide ABC transporter ATP-binding protein